MLTGGTVVLDVTATPPLQQSIAGHSWAITSGAGSLTDATTATPTYHAPATGTGLVVIQDTVTASAGGTASDSLTVAYHDTSIIAAENTLTGTARATWDLPTTALGGISTLQGFADGFTVDRTETVSFKVAQSDGAGWTAQVYRLGYYAGDGARYYATLEPTPTQLGNSQAQPSPGDADPVTTKLSADCSNWSTTLTWTPPAWVPSGMYVLRLDRTGGGASHILFILRDDTRVADLIVMPSDTTWMAYNAFGGMGTSNWLAGNSLYFGTAINQYHTDCARFVSYDRPVINREAATSGVTYGSVEWSTFFTAEYPMLRFLERNGIDCKYYGCIDAAGDPTGIKLIGNGTTEGGATAAMFIGHNEYWSDVMRAGWETAQDAGISVFSCAGNEVFWRMVGTDPDTNGRPRTYECYKSTIAARASTGRPEWTGTWRDPDGAGKGGDDPENTFTGTIFMVNGPTLRSLAVPFSGGYSAQPLWRHSTVAALTTGQTYTSPNQILGFEWDTYGPAGTDSAGAVYLADPHPVARYCSHVTHSLSAGFLLTDAGDTYDATGNVTHRLVVMPNGPDGGITFGTGTINWSLGCDAANTYQLGNDNTSTPIQQATINILVDMGVTPHTLMGGLTDPDPVVWFALGELAGTLPALTGALYVNQGSLTAALPASVGSLTGTTRATGTLSGSLPAAASSVTGTATASSTITGQLTFPLAAVTGTATTAGALSGAASALTGSLSGTATATGTGVLAATLPMGSVSATATATATGQLAGTLPSLVSVLTEAVTSQPPMIVVNVAIRGTETINVVYLGGALVT